MSARRSRKPTLPIPHGAVEIKSREVGRELQKDFRDLGRWLGRPEFRGRIRGSLLMIWRLSADPGTDAAGVVRMSPEDRNKGLTAFSQAREVMAAAQQRGLRLRYLIVTTHNTAARPYEDRPDFELLTQWLLEGWLERVIYRSLDRLAREIIPGELFFKLMQETDTELHLAHFSAEAIDWSDDQLKLRIDNLLSALERERTAQRTQNATIEQWLKTGRGYPRLQLPGTKRDKDDYLICDPRPWRAVVKAREVFIRAEAKGENAWRVVQAHLAKHGIKANQDRVFELLKLPVYETGQHEVEYLGGSYALREIKATIYAAPEISHAVRERLALTDGKHTNVRIGEFALNGILGFHRPCKGKKWRGDLIRLRARVQDRKQNMKDTGTSKNGSVNDRQGSRAAKPRVLGYRHTKLPAGQADRSECLGLDIPKQELEAAFFSAARRAARHLPDGQPFTKKERAIFQAEIDEAERALDEKDDDFIHERAKARERGGDLGPVDWERWCGAVERRLRRAQKRYRVRDALSRQPDACPLVLSKKQKLEIFDRLMCDATPKDDVHCIRRAAMAQALVSYYECWHDEEGKLQIQLYGPIRGNEDDPRPVFPLQTCAGFIQAEALEMARSNKNEVRARRRKTMAAGQRKGAKAEVQTVVQGYAKTTVCTPISEQLGSVKAALPWSPEPRKKPAEPLRGSAAWSFGSDGLQERDGG